MMKKLKEKLDEFIMENILFTCPGMGKLTKEEAIELLEYIDECFK